MSATRPPVAVTGGTGFIGREVVRRLVENGWPVRALTRRPDPGLERPGVVAIGGALEDKVAVTRLVEGCTAVVHCAGAVAAPSLAAFRRVNAVGATQVMTAAGAAATRPRFLLLSSLAAREPALSAYASSKRLGEDQVRCAAGERVELCILRPPAVYGPGDRATLPIFRQLRRGLLLVPAVAAARFSLIYVEDLADLIAHLLDQPDWSDRILEPHDGRAGGYRWPDLAEIAGQQLGRRVRTVALPRAFLWPVAAVGEAAAATLGRPPAISLGKLRELFHSDWVCRTAKEPLLADWFARTTFEVGFARTAAWYERNRWL